MAIVGQARSFHERFKWICEVPVLGSSGFAKCSELSVEVGRSSTSKAARSPPTRALAGS